MKDGFDERVALKSVIIVGVYFLYEFLCPTWVLMHFGILSEFWPFEASVWRGILFLVCLRYSIPMTLTHLRNKGARCNVLE